MGFVIGFLARGRHARYPTLISGGPEAFLPRDVGSVFSGRCDPVHNISGRYSDAESAMRMAWRVSAPRDTTQAREKSTRKRRTPAIGSQRILPLAGHRSNGSPHDSAPLRAPPLQSSTSAGPSFVAANRRSCFFRKYWRRCRCRGSSKSPSR